ncbi:MAG: hypothetical protein JKY56_14380 [Kofleriaceae bacterium]|nr:hypothetical protein [Kofleriaceae bacterium]
MGRLVGVLILGVFLSGCGNGNEPAPRPGAASADSPPVLIVDEDRAAPQTESVQDLAASRTQSTMGRESEWAKVSEFARDKIAPCAAAVPSGPRGAPESTHREGEKYYTYVSSGLEEYQGGVALKPGAAVIKRTFTVSDNKTTGYFLMMKEQGANPSGGDWLYATTSAEGKLIRAGVLEDCESCHKKRSAFDYLFRAGQGMF